MIAVPVKTNKENPAVTTLFGKAKWFAFIKEGEISIEHNALESGRDVVTWMEKKGVKQLVFHSMGGNPFMLLQRAGIECYHSGDERILLQDVLEKLQQNELTLVTGSNMAQFVESGKMHNKNGSHHEHDHDHHHGHHHHH